MHKRLLCGALLSLSSPSSGLLPRHRISCSSSRLITRRSSSDFTSHRRFSMSSSNDDTTRVPRLSVEELRARRLAALEGGRAASTAALAATLLRPAPAAPPAPTQKPAAARRIGVEADVIDLCVDSDDDTAAAADASLSAKGERKRKRPVQGETAARPMDTTRTAASEGATAASATSKAAAPTGCRAVARFRMTTYNVWFGPLGDAAPHGAARMAAIARSVLAAPQTWFAGFQEVTTESLAALGPRLEAAGYITIRQANRAPYFCLLAVRQLADDPQLLDGTWVDFRQTRMGRGFCAVRVRLPSSSTQILVATTHLESWTGPDSTGARERMAQLLEFAEYAQAQMREHPDLQYAAIMGDLNWDDERKNPTDAVMTDVLSGCPVPWTDTWLAVRCKPSDKCYTYDAKENPMLGGNLRRRFDRTIVLSRNDDALTRLQVRSTALIGTETLPGLTFEKLNTYTRTYSTKPVAPSDHFGFVSELQIQL